MAEYKRTDKNQFVASEIAMVIDTVTGEPCRFGRSHNSCGTFDEAMDYVINNMGGFQTRRAIVRIPCVKGVEL